MVKLPQMLDHFKRYDLSSVKKGCNASAKRFDPDQSVQSAQTDLRQNCLQPVNFLHFKRLKYTS